MSSVVSFGKDIEGRREGTYMVPSFDVDGIGGSCMMHSGLYFDVMSDSMRLKLILGRFNLDIVGW